MDDIPQHVIRFIQGYRAERVIKRFPFEDIFYFICSILFSNVDVKASTVLRKAVRNQVIEKRWDLVLIFLKLLQVPNEVANAETLKEDILVHDKDGGLLGVYLHILALYFNLDIFVVEKDQLIWRYYQAVRVNLDREFKIGDKVYQDRKGEVPGQKRSSTFITIYLGSDGMFYEIESRGDRVRPPHSSGILEQYASQLQEYPASEIEALPEQLEMLKRNASMMRDSTYKKDIRNIGNVFWDELIKRDAQYAGCKPRRMSRSSECIISMLEKAESQIPRTVFIQILVKTRSIRLLQLLLEDICVEDILFKRYKALLNLETTLDKMRNALDRFGVIPTEFRERRGRVNKAVIGTSVSGAVGGILGIIGLALIPVTFGASLGLTIAGGVIGGVSGFSQAGFRIHEAVKQNGSTSDMKKEWENITTNLNDSIVEVEELFKVNKGANDVEHDVPGKNLRGILSVGNVARSLHGGVGIGIAAAKVAATTATTVVAILGPIGLLLDIGFLTEAAVNKYNGDQCIAANMVECLIVNESILLTHYRGNTEANEQIVEGALMPPT